MDSNYWRLVKNARAGVKNVTVTATSASILGNNPKRMSLVVGPPTTNPIYLSFRGSTATTADLRIAAGGQPLILNRWDHGEIVCCEIHAVSTGGNETVPVIEASAPELP